MNASTKSLLQSLAKGVAWLLIAIGAAAFWVGGKFLSEFNHIPRGLAEIAGISIAMVCFGLGAVLKYAGAMMKTTRQIMKAAKASDF